IEDPRARPRRARRWRGDDRDGCRAGWAIRPALPEPQHDARGWQVRPGESLQPRSASTSRGHRHCSTAQAGAWNWESAARPGDRAVSEAPNVSGTPNAGREDVMTTLAPADLHEIL